ncbi:MAG TPA: hypothetical protein VE326_11200 [Candidatus Binatia bacterium]|nr:hypothetical protein [Candidatus Binatia bacterium]
MANDLLDSLGNDAPDGVVDLLDGLGEGADASAWMPTEAGQGVQGTVVAVSKTTSEYVSDPIPVITLETATGEKVRVTGYQSVLRREIEEVDPQRGDLFACKYLGRKSTKDGKREFHAYKAAVRRGAGTRAASTGNKPPF